MNTDLGMRAASQGDLVQAFRGTYNGVADKVIFETSVLPLIALVNLSNRINGTRFDGPKLLDHCLENSEEEDVQALFKLALVYLCCTSELALKELARNKVKEDNAINN